MRVDLGGGRGWLAELPAKSLRRVDRQIGHLLQINEAGRSPEQADKNYAAYRAYVAYQNGGPVAPWAPIALPASQSVHCIGGAIDTDERITAVLNDHGWFHTVYRNGVLVEAWHYEYFYSRDNHRHETIELTQTASGSWVFLDAAPVAPIPQEESDMRIITGPGGAQKFVDELGADDIGNYFFVTPDYSWQDNILASWKLTGVDHEKGETPEGATNWKEYELVRHLADARWNRKRGQIVTETVTAVVPAIVAAFTPLLQALVPTIDIAELRAAVGDAATEALKGIVIEAPEISDEDKQGIASLAAEMTVQLQAQKLSAV